LLHPVAEVVVKVLRRLVSLSEALDEDFLDLILVLLGKNDQQFLCHCCSTEVSLPVSYQCNERVDQLKKKVALGVEQVRIGMEMRQVNDHSCLQGSCLGLRLKFKQGVDQR